MTKEIMVYGFVEVSADRDGVYDKVYYFANEAVRDDVMMLCIADNLDCKYYPFEKKETVEV